ncbi:hypothetical protein [Pseudoalteromonas sp. Of7M-16]|uniref:hypothetical protein n=1 Tax=Pseudoalteromonas sp. Of7M-16 TaxID=2917756 RepID=UPI001EF43347|nr:hypothetical protein [Pseudoalteromonas sp. Of7M-16]MCG7548024.1 hypothetical protein [Pseudoalteromonas sp. Of7M-16]
MNRWILFLLLYVGTSSAESVQLDVYQCDRYAAELVFLQQNTEMKQSDQARITRLIERIEHYCESPTVARKPPVEARERQSVFGHAHYSDPEIYAQWQAFFQKPAICHHGEQNFQSAVKCAEMVAKQRQAFESRLDKQKEAKERNRRTELTRASKEISQETTTPPSVASKRDDTSYQLNTDIALDKNAGHFSRFGFWLSIVLCGYLFIELIKHMSRSSSTINDNKKRSFKPTYHALTSKLDNKKYIIVHRSMSPLLEELDIDGVALSPFGLFVFVSCPYVGEIEANLESEMWHVTREGGAQYFLNPLNAVKIRASKLAECVGAKSGVKYIVTFNSGCQFYPGKPVNCFEIELVAFEVMRYTQFIFSYEQLRYFEQRLYSQSHALETSHQIAS